MKLTMENAVTITSDLMHLMPNEVSDVEVINQYLKVTLHQTVSIEECRIAAADILHHAREVDPQTTAWVQLEDPRHILLMFED
jgi:hypothetical protein